MVDMREKLMTAELPICGHHTEWVQSTEPLEDLLE